MTTKAFPAPWPCPTDRVIHFAMHTFECDEGAALAVLVDLRNTIRLVGREFGWTMEEAALQVVRLDAATPPLMSRHRFTKAEAIIELLRAGA